jgi:hypothetical protein
MTCFLSLRRTHGAQTGCHDGTRFGLLSSHKDENQKSVWFCWAPWLTPKPAFIFLPRLADMHAFDDKSLRLSFERLAVEGHVPKPRTTTRRESDRQKSVRPFADFPALTKPIRHIRLARREPPPTPTARTGHGGTLRLRYTARPWHGPTRPIESRHVIVSGFKNRFPARATICNNFASR